MGFLKKKGPAVNEDGIPILDPQNAMRSTREKRNSGMDISFGTMMKWMHKNDHTGSETINATGKSVHELIHKVESQFPGAMPVHRMANAVEELLASHDVMTDNTLLATSLCYDELNKGIEQELSAKYGHAFTMGGLAGYCFGGNVGFGNMLHHAPGDGNCLLLYGPHLGIDMDGTFGKVNRENQKGSSECCGPAHFCMEYCKKVRAGERKAPTAPADITESQQTWVCKELMPFMDRIEEAENPKCELPACLFESQDKIIHRILDEASHQLNSGAHIALLGGITINTPEWLPEYFLPKTFVMINDDGEIIKDMLEELLATKAPVYTKKH